MDLPAVPSPQVTPPPMTPAPPLPQSVPVVPPTPVQQQPQQVSKKYYSFIPWLVSGLVCIGIFLAALLVIPPDAWYAWKHFAAQYITHGEYIVVEDQAVGYDYIIKEAVLKKSGRIVLIATDTFDTPSDFIFGVSEILPAGVVKNVPIAVDFDIMQEGMKTALVPGRAVIVALVYDTPGIGVFDNPHPEYVKDITGSYIFVKMKLL